MAQEEFKASEKSDGLLGDAQAGNAVSDAYNNLSSEQQKQVFTEMTSTNESGSDLPDLVISGMDTDSDGKDDTLLDVYDRKTGEDLYNRPGEIDNSPEAVSARQAQMTMRTFEGITNKDEIEDPAKLAEWTENPDVQKIFSTVQDSIQRMIDTGKRLPGEGGMSAWLNNAKHKYGDGETYECYDQAEFVGKDLFAAAGDLKGDWDVHFVGDVTGLGLAARTISFGHAESPGHYKLEMVPHDKSNPTIIIDPWKGEFELKDSNTYEPNQELYRMADVPGVGNHADRVRQERYNTTMADYRKVEGEKPPFRQWVRENREDHKDILQIGDDYKTGFNGSVGDSWKSWWYGH